MSHTPYFLLSSPPGASLVLTCEHASCSVPPELGGLGVDPKNLRDHIGWDVGAGDLTLALADRLRAPAVLSSVSRLVIDCNRELGDHDLIVEESDLVPVPANRDLGDEERMRRVRAYYEPYHAAIDRVLAEQPAAMLLSIHSFTPALQGSERPFDAGVLFDNFEADAETLAAGLRQARLSVRLNEPYSGMDGLIFSARSHGLRHGRRYLELEVNNRLLRDRGGVTRIANAVAAALAPLLISA